MKIWTIMGVRDFLQMMWINLVKGTKGFWLTVNTKKSSVFWMTYPCVSTRPYYIWWSCILCHHFLLLLSCGMNAKNHAYMCQSPVLCMLLQASMHICGQSPSIKIINFVYKFPSTVLFNIRSLAISTTTWSTFLVMFKILEYPNLLLLLSIFDGFKEKSSSYIHNILKMANLCVVSITPVMKYLQEVC